MFGNGMPVTPKMLNQILEVLFASYPNNLETHSCVLAAAAAAAAGSGVVVVVVVYEFVADAVQPGVGQEGSLVLRALLLQLYSQSSLEYQSLLASYGIFLCVCAILHSR